MEKGGWRKENLISPSFSPSSIPSFPPSLPSTYHPGFCTSSGFNAISLIGKGHR